MSMKKVLLLLFVLVLTGCEQIDRDALKEEIKTELSEELAYDYSDFQEQLITVTNYVTSCSVAVEITLADQSQYHGSGLIYQKDGNTYYVLTNEHVIRYHTSIEVYIPSDKRYISASVSSIDEELDLAILTISSLQELNLCEINLVDYAVGEFVLAVGAPVELDYANSVTLGIISKIDTERIQHDAAINLGNSGGPLFTLNGDFIGLNVSKLNTTTYGGSLVNVEGLGFAIPVEKIIDFINE